MIFARDDKIKSLADLKGKQLAIDMGGSQFQVTKIYANAKGIDLGKDIITVNANFAVARAQLEAGGASMPHWLMRRLQASPPGRTRTGARHLQRRARVEGDHRRGDGWEIVTAMRADAIAKNPKAPTNAARGAAGRCQTVMQTRDTAAARQRFANETLKLRARNGEVRVHGDDVLAEVDALGVGVDLRHLELRATHVDGELFALEIGERLDLVVPGEDHEVGEREPGGDDPHRHAFLIELLQDSRAAYEHVGLAGREGCVSAGIKISMDGRGRWMDNVFIERLWRSLKHEDIYLRGYADGREAKAGIATGSPFTRSTLHQALGYRTPMAVWREAMQAAKAVDMMDNADALTTCPQQQQQTESLAT